MSETPKEEKNVAPFNLDMNKILPTIANLYKQLGWTIPIIEKLSGYKIPPEIITALDTLATGKPLSPEQMQNLKTQVETMQPGVGEPVMTRHLAEDAWLMHEDGMGTREIAEAFTKQGSPCSHSTVARWINLMDAEKRFSRIAKLIKFGKIAGFIGLMALMFVIGKFLL